MRREVFEQFGNHLKVGQFQFLCGDPLMNAIRSESGKNELRISRPEFTLWCLIQARVVDPKFVATIFRSFDKLDHDRNGFLTMIDTQIPAQSRSRRRRSSGGNEDDTSELKKK